MTNPSLIEQMQQQAAAGTGSVASLMRLAKLAASKLKAEEFGAWLEAEIRGYVGKDGVPPYRMVPAVPKFYNPQYGWCPIVSSKGPVSHDKAVGQPISELESLVESRGRGDFLTMEVPASFREAMVKNMGMRFDIQYHVSIASIIGVLDAVRNEIIDWSIRLEAAGIYGQGMTFSPAEAVAAKSVQNYFHGPVAAVTQGGGTVGPIYQTNASASTAELADAIARVLAAIPRGAELPAKAAEAISDLASAEPELRDGRVSAGRISRALSTLRGAEDFVAKLPGVAEAVSHLAALFGF